MGTIYTGKLSPQAWVSYRNGLVEFSTSCDECNEQYLRMDITLREFLDALNITAEDCQKAFEEWEE